MYNLFNNYFEFRGAMFIPGWIPDLSTGDVVKTFSFNIPLIGNQLRLLPVIYVATQLLSGKITQYGQTTAPGQSQATMKFMMYGMPLMFFFIFYNAPSGLLLYWLTSNILQIFQQLIINKMMKDKRAEKDNGGFNLFGNLMIQVITIICIIHFRYNDSSHRFWNDIMEHPIIASLGIISYIGIIVYWFNKQGES
jgi:membrane protein insertase Oxa1/YidC/SpoIIIJ